MYSKVFLSCLTMLLKTFTHLVSLLFLKGKSLFLFFLKNRFFGTFSFLQCCVPLMWKKLACFQQWFFHHVKTWHDSCGRSEDFGFVHTRQVFLAFDIQEKLSWLLELFFFNLLCVVYFNIETVPQQSLTDTASGFYFCQTLRRKVTSCNGSFWANWWLPDQWTDFAERIWHFGHKAKFLWGQKKGN